MGARTRPCQGVLAAAGWKAGEPAVYSELPETSSLVTFLCWLSLCSIPVTWSVGTLQFQEHSAHNLQPCGQSSKRIAPVRFETLPCTGQNSGLKIKYCDKELSDLKKQTVCPQCPITSCFSAHHPQPPIPSPLQKGNSALLCPALFSFSHCLQTKSLLLARAALICKALKFLSTLPFHRHLGRGFFKHGFGA